MFTVVGAMARYDPATFLPDLLGPPMPPGTESGWEMFWALHETRGMAMTGLLPITYAEMDAYQRLTQRRITPLEAALIREADRAIAAEIRDRQPQDQAAPNLTQE